MSSNQRAKRTAVSANVYILKIVLKQHEETNDEIPEQVWVPLSDQGEQSRHCAVVVYSQEKKVCVYSMASAGSVVAGKPIFTFDIANIANHSPMQNRTVLALQINTPEEGSNYAETGISQQYVAIACRSEDDVSKLSSAIVSLSKQLYQSRFTQVLGQILVSGDSVRSVLHKHVDQATARPATPSRADMPAVQTPKQLPIGIGAAAALGIPMLPLQAKQQPPQVPPRLQPLTPRLQLPLPKQQQQQQQHQSLLSSKPPPPPPAPPVAVQAPAVALSSSPAKLDSGWDAIVREAPSALPHLLDMMKEQAKHMIAAHEVQQKYHESQKQYWEHNLRQMCQ